MLKRQSIEVQGGYTPAEAQVLMLHHLAVAAALFEVLPELHVAPRFENTPADIAAKTWLETIKAEYRKMEQR